VVLRIIASASAGFQTSAARAPSAGRVRLVSIINRGRSSENEIYLVRRFSAFVVEFNPSPFFPRNKSRVARWPVVEDNRVLVRLRFPLRRGLLARALSTLRVARWILDSAGARDDGGKRP
jgi:hypothetical protein